MAFNTQKNKLKNISTNINSNTDTHSKQKLTDTELDKEYRRTISSIQLFKQEIDLSSNWETMIPMFGHVPTGINLYKTWNVEINNVPEKWIPGIHVELLYRNQTSNDDLTFIFPYKNIFFEVEDISDSKKKVTVHASLYLLESFDSPGLQGLLEAKMRLILRNPNEFI